MTSHTITERLEEAFIRGCNDGRTCTVEQQLAETLTVLIASDQVAYVLAGRSVSALPHLIIDERSELLWERDVHRRHT
jgi:hypothetical protein